MKAGTPAERRISKYLIEHLAELPFESAATLAEKLNLSPMTVGRFLRGLGYRQLSDIREDLREPVAPEAEPLDKRASFETQSNPLSSLLLQQIQSVQSVYDLSGHPEWQEALTSISESANVFIASSAEGFGICRHFYSKLLEWRENVHYLQRDGSNYIALMDEVPQTTLLVLMDCGDNLALLQHLSKVARTEGYRTLLITTRFYEWGPESADICLTIPLAQNGGHSMLQLVAMVEFMLHALTLQNEPARKKRFKRVGDLQRVLNA
jgi:DNA-binding MurR/RpiR family transcriptional regulator